MGRVVQVLSCHEVLKEIVTFGTTSSVEKVRSCVTITGVPHVSALVAWMLECTRWSPGMWCPLQTHHRCSTAFVVVAGYLPVLDL